jgi:hypothetical protein
MDLPTRPLSFVATKRSSGVDEAWEMTRLSIRNQSVGRISGSSIASSLLRESLSESKANRSSSTTAPSQPFWTGERPQDVNQKRTSVYRTSFRPLSGSLKSESEKRAAEYAAAFPKRASVVWSAGRDEFSSEEEEEEEGTVRHSKHRSSWASSEDTASVASRRHTAEVPTAPSAPHPRSPGASPRRAAPRADGARRPVPQHEEVQELRASAARLVASGRVEEAEDLVRAINSKRASDSDAAAAARARPHFSSSAEWVRPAGAGYTGLSSLFSDLYSATALGLSDAELERERVSARIDAEHALAGDTREAARRASAAPALYTLRDFELSRAPSAASAASAPAARPRSQVGAGWRASLPGAAPRPDLALWRSRRPEARGGAAGEGEGGLAAGEVPAEGGGAPSTRGLMREMLGRDLLFE